MIGLDDCLFDVGPIQLLPIPPEVQKARRDPYFEPRGDAFAPYSRKFQWMSCDVEFTADYVCRIVLYINNLHPKFNRSLYEVIEKILTRTIPLWDSPLTRLHGLRDGYNTYKYLDHVEPEPTRRVGESGNEFWDRHSEWEATRAIELPEPDNFSPRTVRPSKPVRLRDMFAKMGLQVIIKLANIELTSEKPGYDGGSWHIEGQLVSHVRNATIKRLTPVE